MNLLPIDDNSNPIQALRLKQDGAHAIAAATGAASSNATPFDSKTRVVAIYATGPVYLKFGAAGVTATNADHYFPGGVYQRFAVAGGNGNQAAPYAYLSTLAVSAASEVYVSEME